MADLVLSFARCFDQNKVAAIVDRLPKTYEALDELAPWREGQWPTEIRCMSDSRIAEGRSHGAGHGVTQVGCISRRGCNWIEMNPYLTPDGLWLVLIHENLHHAFPDATEDEINNVLVQRVYKRVTGHSLNSSWARKQGLGPPEPGIGDRGYVR
jgi:hypothetical protein